MAFAQLGALAASLQSPDPMEPSPEEVRRAETSGFNALNPQAAVSQTALSRAFIIGMSAFLRSIATSPDLPNFLNLDLEKAYSDPTINLGALRCLTWITVEGSISPTLGIEKPPWSAVSPPSADFLASVSTAPEPSLQSNFQSPGQSGNLQETVEQDAAEKPTAVEPPQDMSRLFYEYSRREFETLETLGCFSAPGSRAIPAVNESEKLERVHSGDPTTDDIEYAILVSDEGGWVLKSLERGKLYAQLFLPLDPGGMQHIIFLEQVLDQINLLRQIQKFALVTILERVASDSDIEPRNLDEFLEDARTMLQILYNTPERLGTIEEIRNAHPFLQFWALRANSRTRSSIPKLEDRSSHTSPSISYAAKLCDILFGFWPEDRPTVFDHRDNQIGRSCQIAYLLQSLDLNPRTVHAPPLDYRRFDAAYIESRGPFRLKETTDINEHLLITPKNEILFYSDWPRWRFLRYHRVIARPVDVSHWTGFDVLTSERYVGVNLSSVRIKLNWLFYTQSVTSLIFFLQGTITPNKIRSSVPDKSDSSSTESSLRRSFWQRPHPSLKIGKRIGVPKLEDVLLQSGIVELRGVAFDWTRIMLHSHFFRSMDPFKYRLDKLHETLVTWKPTTIWEMRYRGYGSVDPVGLYAFYFATIVGVVALVGAVLTLVQTYASLKQLEVFNNNNNNVG